jgi:DNA polymerase-1
MNDCLLEHGVSLHRMTATDDIPEFFSWLSQSRPVLGVDTENSGLSPEKDTIRYVQFGDLSTGWALEWGRWSGVAIEALSRYDGDLVFHNSKYDIRFLEHHSSWRAPWHRVHDTMVMVHITDPLRPKGLKPVAERLVTARAADSRKNLDEVMRDRGWGWDTVPVDYKWYWVYAALDPVLTCHLYDKLSQTVFDKYSRPYDLEMGSMRAAHSMEQYGMRVDTEYCARTDAEYTAYVTESKAYLSSIFGIDNPTSKQLLKYYQDQGVLVPAKRTPGGDQCMDKEVLAGIDHPSAKVVLNIRKYDKLAGTYFKNLIELSEGDGRVHPNVWTLGTRTGRMTVTSPALQTLPKKDTTIRSAFIPDEGMALISVDFNQIEARLMAHFSGSRSMVEAFLGKDDFFCTIAGNIYNTNIGRHDPRRDLTKGTIYGKLYGAGVAKMADTSGVSVQDMQNFVNMFDSRYPDVKRMQSEIERVGSERYRTEGEGYVITPTGRRLPCDEGKVYTLTNYLIQGHAAEIFKRALIDVESLLEGVGDLLLPVHDEIVAQCPVAVAPDMVGEIERAMSDTDGYSVPITADGVWSAASWADMVGR